MHRSASNVHKSLSKTTKTHHRSPKSTKNHTKVHQNITGMHLKYTEMHQTHQNLHQNTSRTHCNAPETTKIHHKSTKCTKIHTNVWTFHQIYKTRYGCKRNINPTTFACSALCGGGGLSAAFSFQHPLLTWDTWNISESYVFTTSKVLQLTAVQKWMQN